MLNMTRDYDDLEPLTDTDETMVDPNQQPPHVSYMHLTKDIKPNYLVQPRGANIWNRYTNG